MTINTEYQKQFSSYQYTLPQSDLIFMWRAKPSLCRLSQIGRQNRSVEYDLLVPFAQKDVKSICVMRVSQTGRYVNET
jgi:hypothetical protein